MRPKVCHVPLAPEQRGELTRKSVSQKQSVRERKCAHILLLADEAQEGGAIPASRALAHEAALLVLEEFHSHADPLCALARFVVERDS